MGKIRNGDDSRLRSRVLRRWYVALAGVVATALFCVAATILVPVSYTAKADILLTPPPTTGANGNPNPYLILGGMLPLADVVSRAMTAGPNLTSLRAHGLTDSFTAATDPATNSPVVDVAAEGTTAAAAMHNLRLVLATAPTVLTQLQNAQSVPSSARVKAQVISLPTQASAVKKSQTRAILVALVLGVVATLAAVSLVDKLLLRRRRRRDAASSAVTTAEVVLAPAETDARHATVALRKEHPAASIGREADEAAAEQPSEQRPRGKLLAVTQLRR